MSKLFRIVEDHLPHVHCYADDIQIYLSFKPISNTSQEDAVRAMECCIEKIRRWLIHDRLLLDDDKTEFIIIGTRQQLNKLQAMNIKVGGSEIKPSYQVKNLGSWLDPNLNMRHHITNVCRRVSSTCIILDALRSIYRETAYSPWYTHSSRAG